ncbi:hypothetical protein LA080_001288 [Diaporthe eres]|nr:hypothetical protein LA080_001288 [Diaporthe eres]
MAEEGRRTRHEGRDRAVELAPERSVTRAGGVGQDWNPQAHIAFGLGMIIEIQNEMDPSSTGEHVPRLQIGAYVVVDSCPSNGPKTASYPTTTKAETMSQERKRSTSRTRVSRPTTPLRPSSRSSFRESAKGSTSGGPSFPLNAFEPAFAELSDAMSDLEANMMHFQLMHESLARFSESFASFMYGLNMNAFCVDYPEGPISESFRRAKQHEEQATTQVPDTKLAGDPEGETTFMTTDTSFVDNPSSTRTAAPKFQTPAPKTRTSRYVAGAKKKPPTVYLRCHVKPGASKVREGITALTDSTIELCVSAVPKDGESNKAVLAVLSEALGVPRSDLQITRGAKSRDKVIALAGKAVQDKETECVDRLLKRLNDAIESDGS